MISTKHAPILLLMVATLAGCGGPEHPDVGEVSGTVTLDDKPLAEASIMFQPSNGRASTGTTDANGKYSLMYLDGVSGAMIGSNKVMISTQVDGEDGQPPLVKEKLPPRYHSRTELTADVKAGSNTFDFKLTSGPGAGK